MNEWPPIIQHYVRNADFFYSRQSGILISFHDACFDLTTCNYWSELLFREIEKHLISRRLNMQTMSSCLRQA